MANRFQFLIFIFSAISSFAWAKTPYPEAGHLEFMMAGGGSANICSPGQFMLNPAGLVCGNKNDLSESFGSTNFSASRVQFGGAGNINDLDAAQTQTRPGLSIFSQSTHSQNSVFGAWGSLNQFTLDKAASITGAAAGSLEMLQSNSEWHFGGFYAKKFERFSWGSTLSFGQREYRNIQNIKYRVGPDYISQYDDTIAVEKFLTAQIGVLRQSGSISYAFAIRAPRYSLGGKVLRNVTDIRTNNQFAESSRSAEVKSSEPWLLTAGSEYMVNQTDRLAVDLNWSSASRSDFADLRGGQEDAPTVTLIVSSKIQISPKSTFVSGVRWAQTIQELESQGRYQIPMLSLGILRTFKGVELGTGIAYSKGESEDYNAELQKWQKMASLERLDFTFSSSFSY